MTSTNEDRTYDGTQRFSVQQAADILGISTEATRQRIKRGTLPTERDEDGNVFVLLEADGTRTTDDGTHTNTDRTGDGTAQIESQQDQIEYLRKQLDKERESSAELRRIIAALTQRIPAIEAPSEAPTEFRDGDLTASEELGGMRGRPVSQEPEQHRSWLYRVLFGT